MIKSGRASLYSISSVFILWVAAVLDPVGKFWGLRYIALVLIYLDLIIGLITLDTSFKAGRYYYLVFCYFVLLLPGFGLIVGLIRGGLGRDFIDTSYLAAAVYFGCSLIYLKGDLLYAGLKAQVFALRLLSLVIVFCLIVFAFGLPLDWIWLFVANGAAYFGGRSYANMDFFYIYFIASPMIIVLLTYEAWRFFDRPSFVGIILVFLPVVALVLSGTRANILIGALGVPFVYLWRKFGSAAIVWGVLTLLVLGAILRMFGSDLLQSMFNSGEASNATKIAYLRGYEEIFSDPVSFIFGQGFNAQAWSKPFFDMLGENASKTELTFVELFRVFGLFVGGLFFAIIFQMIRGFDERESPYRWMAPAIAMYGLVSMLNPYVFSSNGILVLGFAAAVGGKNIEGSGNRMGKSRKQCSDVIP